jgi:hypothetical protein
MPRYCILQQARHARGGSTESQVSPGTIDGAVGRGRGPYTDVTIRRPSSGVSCRNIDAHVRLEAHLRHHAAEAVDKLPAKVLRSA